MTYFDLEREAKRYYPAIALDNLLPRTVRAWSIKILSVLALLTFAGSIPGFVPGLTQRIAEFIPQITVFVQLAQGGLFLCLTFLMPVFALHAFHNSFYFRGYGKTLSEKASDDSTRLTYEVAVFCYGANTADMTRSFIGFSYGNMILLRSGLEPAEIAKLAQETVPFPAERLVLEPSEERGVIHTFDIALALFRQDARFSDFLFKHGIQEKNFSDAAHWMLRDIARYKKHLRWWSRDTLGRIEGIGKDWAYGTAFRLRQYADEITSHDLPQFSSFPKYIQEDIERLEASLSRNRQANSIIVGEDGGSKRQVLQGFCSLVQEGKVFPSLEHKKVYVFNPERLISAAREKTKFEFEFIKLLDESATAGNVIMVIEDLPGFIESASRIGSNAVSLLSPYLDSPVIQFICFSSPTPFHQAIEPDETLITKFEVMILKEGEALDIIQTLQDEASSVESQYGIMISQPTLSVIAESADRYVTEGVMPDKAIDLLHELAAKFGQQGKKYLVRADVLEFVKAKTGIPTGTVSSAEQDKLVRLEEYLHQRVIGQDEAVKAIANAMRRARAGVTNPNRPIGSFLFMGPTGVGKTETTKALAQTFFGDDNRILRLDMSEYKAEDALPKLIGSFGSNTPGVLTSMLREKPYGVLLLDEFEKTTKDVMDLFLQVLDEGMFSDMRGKKVNARNMIIIATSNAGSDLIWDYVKRGENLAEKKNEVIETIVKEGIFKPELLNRFDGVILFEPIDSARLREIAKLMLERFRGRIRTRGIDLEITEDLVNFLMQFGSDPKFGARPMNRAIQDTVEQKIADKIIQGAIKPGEKIVLTAEDLV